jgi:hypothetical protein
MGTARMVPVTQQSVQRLAGCKLQPAFTAAAAGCVAMLRSCGRHEWLNIMVTTSCFNG